jgi:RNA polymerase sigma-70 factor (ECF subfamily)
LSQNEGKHSASERPSQVADVMPARMVVERACVQMEADLKVFLVGVLKNHHLAEDIFQKTVIRAIEAADSVQMETLRGWLFRIALNEARQFQREQRREAGHREKIANALLVERSEQLSLSDAHQMAEMRLVNNDLSNVLKRSLEKLPSVQQEVIRRRVYDGLTFAEIAVQMGLPIGTVLTWMRRGLLKLKEDSGLKSLRDDFLD